MDHRRKRLKYQSHHRGFKEADLILGSFADRYLDEMSPEQLDQFEALLNLPDVVLYGWAIGRDPVPAEYECEVLTLLKAFEFPGRLS